MWGRERLVLLYMQNLKTDLGELLTGGLLTERWSIICGWGIVFLVVMAFIYVSLSSWSRVFFKKTKSVICFFISLAITCIASYVLFYILPWTFVFPDTEIGVNLESSVNVRFLDREDINTANEISIAQSSTLFFVYAEGLSKGNRYGMRVLDENKESVKEESKFRYCKDMECSFNFGQLNTVGDRLDEGSYTIQIISQKGNELEVVGMKEIQITELVIQQYEAGRKYPCEMWLTIGDSDEKLLRIDVDSQELTDITVMAQCSGGGVYEAQIAVGTLSNEVMYYQSTIPSTGEPMAVLGLGGNTSHGYVRLIIDNQVMGEAIIDRGFPMCDDGKQFCSHPLGNIPSFIKWSPSTRLSQKSPSPIRRASSQNPISSAPLSERYLTPYFSITSLAIKQAAPVQSTGNRHPAGMSLI